MKRALVVIDVQNDFCPGGALAVPAGDAVVPVINRLIASGYFSLVVATQDWHPADHRSFASQHPGKSVGELGELNGSPQVMWPDHCVQSTSGAELHPSLEASAIDKIFLKGEIRQVDSYSGFFDNDGKSATGLGDYLKQEGVDEVYVCGLATDYCVKFTALDSRKLGFSTFLIEDAARGVNLQPGDVAQAVEDMRAAGVNVVSSGQILAQA